MRCLLLTSLLAASVLPAQDSKPVAVSGSLSVVFWVDDFDAAVAFWHQVLGAEPVYLLKDVGFGELRTPLDGVRIGIARGKRTGNAVVPTFAVSDLDATLASLKALEVAPLGPITEMPGLCRLASIADPAGNEVQFVESLRPPANPWAKVAFLSGCWRRVAGATMQEEVWTPPHGRSMYGQNRLLHEGKRRFFELLRIEWRGDDLVYVAMPAGGQATEFAMTDSTANSVTFSNPEHDFPKRIKYWLGSDGSLHAVADGGTDEGNKQEFHWQPVR